VFVRRSGDQRSEKLKVIISMTFLKKGYHMDDFSIENPRAKKIIHMMRKGHHTDDPTSLEPQEDARAQKANRQRAERASAGRMITVQPLPMRRKLWFEDIASFEMH
jgi:hypothetical protein